MNELNIMGYTWNIEFREKRHVGATGLMDIDRQVIYIASDVSYEQQITAVLHEIVEAINFKCELGLAHNEIQALASGLFSAVRPNWTSLNTLDWNIKNAQVD